MCPNLLFRLQQSVDLIYEMREQPEEKLIEAVIEKAGFLFYKGVGVEFLLDGIEAELLGGDPESGLVAFQTVGVF